ncbi:hypothetical protein CTEN210_12730 [Chaetoceros tenuissimus]|uniref:Uncharacterized protein n=1 Tax=Chaetoceros tenuissimus TaxID=426638 RepID=A0AAD3HAR9_9STRA|nr:hypothetical protein CTEN210_12730 [Chaetoceros tenuissimus]
MESLRRLSLTPSFPASAGSDATDRDSWELMAMARKDIPLEIVTAHVKSHQDDKTPFHLLPYEAQMNVRMDKQADAVRDGPSAIPPVPDFEDQDFQIKIDGVIAYSNVAATLRKSITGKPLKRYLLAKYEWTDYVFSKVDWDSLEAYLKGLSQQVRTNVLKLRPSSEDPWISIAHGAHGEGYNSQGQNKDPNGNVVDLMVWGENNVGNEAKDLKNAHGGMKAYIRLRQCQDYDLDNIGICSTCGALCEDQICTLAPTSTPQPSFYFSISAHVCLLSNNIVQFVTGYDHTCSLFDDGSVWCNGSNGFGQLGNGGTDNSSTPVQVNLSTGLTDIEAGAYHICAIQSINTALYCWGFNADVQHGLNTIMNENADDKKVIKMAFSMSATCVVTQSDAATVTCVGFDFNTLLNLGQAITKLTSGSTHFSALLLDKTAKCWGANHKGQLGIGSAEFTMAYFDSPVTILETLGTALSNITDINAGYSSMCLVIAGGNAKCFGDNRFHQLGIANGDDNVLYPTDVQVAVILGKLLSSIHVGEYTGHAVFEENSIYSWGSNYGGTFGDGSVVSSRNVIGDVSGVPAAQMAFEIGSSSPSSSPSMSSDEPLFVPSTRPSIVPTLEHSSIPSKSQEPSLLPSLLPSTFPSLSPITTITYLSDLIDSVYENIDVSNSNYTTAFDTAKTWFIDVSNHPTLYLSGNS